MTRSHDDSSRAFFDAFLRSTPPGARCEELRSVLWRAAVNAKGLGGTRTRRGDEARRATDVELVQRFVGGEASAFDEFLERHQDRLVEYARRQMGGDEGLARDIVQTVFLQFIEDAVSRPDILLAHTAPVARVFTSVRFELRNALRHRAKLPGELPDDVDDALAGADNEWLAALERSDDMRRVYDALAAHCSVLEQEIVVQRLNGLHHAAIAEQLEITTGYVRVIKHRALEKLRAHFAHDAEAAS